MAEGLEIVIGQVTGKSGSSAVFEAPCIDGGLCEIEAIAVCRTQQNAVSQLPAQSVDLDVEARVSTFGPSVRPQGFDDERCRRPCPEPENQQRQEGSLGAPLYPSGHTIMENLHAPHYAQFHPISVEA